MPRPFSEEQRRRAIRMKEMFGYQVNELAAALKMPLSFKLKAFDPTTLIEIAVSVLGQTHGHSRLNWLSVLKIV